jgi:hypothetical protein
VVPRAVLVHRVARAQLVHPLPPDQSGLIIGRHYLIVMPYAIEVMTTYRGWLPSVTDLPSHPNRIGDMFTVGPEKVPWIWIWAPGAAHADWLDP